MKPNQPINQLTNLVQLYSIKYSYLIQIICTLLHTIKFSFPMLINLTIFIEPINRYLTGATTPDQSGPGSNGNGRVSLYSTELKPHHPMQFHVIPRTPLFCKEGGSYLSAGYTLNVLQVPPAGFKIGEGKTIE